MELDLFDNFAMVMLVVFAAGGVAYALLGGGGGDKSDERLSAIAGKAQGRKARDKAKPNRDRRAVEDAVREIEQRKDKERRNINARIDQAGLEITKKQYYIYSASGGASGFLLALMLGVPLLVAVGIGVVCGVGIPHWTLSFLASRRINKFVDELPNAVDIIVRGVKSGLPVNDCLRIISTECTEPLRSEFKNVIDQQVLGLPLNEAIGKLYDRVPVPETNFFAIVISFQQRSGGNLSDTLGNLSKVLRDRKKMKAKIQSMSQEAKSSAGIIASLPFAVMLFVYISTPGYISLLWTTSMGLFMLGGCAFWMTCGVLVMRQMINFDF